MIKLAWEREQYQIVSLTSIVKPDYILGATRRYKILNFNLGKSSDILILGAIIFLQI